MTDSDRRIGGLFKNKSLPISPVFDNGDLAGTRMMNFRWALTFFFLLAACNASGPHFQDTPYVQGQVPDHRARIVFLRGSDIDFRSATLEIDGTTVGALAQNGFIVSDIEPGERVLSARVKHVPLGAYVITVNARPGETQYIKVSHRLERVTYPILGPIGTALFFLDRKGDFKLEALAASAAQKELGELKSGMSP
jgi:hypothetical protein